MKKFENHKTNWQISLSNFSCTPDSGLCAECISVGQDELTIVNNKTCKETVTLCSRTPVFRHDHI